MQEDKYREYKSQLISFNQKIKDNPLYIEEIKDQYNEALMYIDDYEEYLNIQNQIEENKKITDKDLLIIVEEDNKILKEKIDSIENKYKNFDKDDFKNVIMEIRSGTGGNEASLFTEEMYEVYKKYISNKGWRLEILDSSVNESGGLKQIILSIKGDMVYGNLKTESGVHRVQRVPKTESSGRIHTSTISVVVLPNINKKDFEIKESDLRFDYFRASGPGGQSVNKTESAVRVTYLPTGMIVTSQNTKSQIQNKENALQILRSRLYEIQKEEDLKKNSDLRKSQIAGAKRSEKIRTYNFMQDRITDHRISKNRNFHINDIFEKNQLQELIDIIKNENS